MVTTAESTPRQGASSCWAGGEVFPFLLSFPLEAWGTCPVKWVRRGQQVAVGCWERSLPRGMGHCHVLQPCASCLCSDGTLNPNGVRFGSSEIYNIGSCLCPAPVPRVQGGPTGTRVLSFKELGRMDIHVAGSPCTHPLFQNMPGHTVSPSEASKQVKVTQLWPSFRFCLHSKLGALLNISSAFRESTEAQRGYVEA